MIKYRTFAAAFVLAASACAGGPVDAPPQPKPAACATEGALFDLMAMRDAVKESMVYPFGGGASADEVFAALKDQAAAAQTDADHLRVLEAFVYAMGDHHSHLSTNGGLSPRLVPTGASVWVEGRNGRLVVTEVRPVGSGLAIRKQGLREGMVKLAEFGAAVPEAPPIELRRGAGAYICGEESAMIESIEGKRGMPRLRPPYVAQVGLFGRPTLEHNFETLYWVRDIVERGPQWFASNGRHGRKGLRSFSVSGRVREPGVKLAPAGITLRELVDEYCGGLPEGHELYAYLPGGASGGILPASMADIPLDFDTLQPHGCFIGSAAVMVLSKSATHVDRAMDAARNLMRFFEDESCGQCTPCRAGTAKTRALIESEQWDTALLAELSQVMRDASICGLGQAAPNPVDCVVRYFPHELER